MGISHIFSTSMILSFIYTSKRSPKPSRLGTPRPALTKDGGSLQPRPTLPSPNMAALATLQPVARAEVSLVASPPEPLPGGVASEVIVRSKSGGLGRRVGDVCTLGVT